MRVETKVEWNSMIYVYSPYPDEEGPPNRVIEDLRMLEMARAVLLVAGKVRDWEDLSLALTKIAQKVKENNLRPTIHFDMHGSKEGMEIGMSKEIVPWNDLQGKCREINIASGNNLTVLMNVCWGLALAEEVDLRREAPFYLLVGPKGLVSGGEIANSTVSFYDSLSSERRLDLALNCLGPSYEKFDCEFALANSLVRYVLRRTRGAVLQFFKENGLNRNAKKRLPKQIQEILKGENEAISENIKKFMIGRKSEINIMVAINEASTLIIEKLEQDKALKMARA